MCKIKIRSLVTRGDGPPRVAIVEFFDTPGDEVDFNNLNLDAIDYQVDLNKTIYNFEFSRTGFPLSQDYFFWNGDETQKNDEKLEMMEQMEKIMEEKIQEIRNISPKEKINTADENTQQIINVGKKKDAEIEKRAKVYTELKFKEKIQETEIIRVEKAAQHFQNSHDKTAIAAAGGKQTKVLQELTETDEKFCELASSGGNGNNQKLLTPTSGSATVNQSTIVGVKMIDESVKILSNEINTWNILLNGRLKMKDQEIVMLEKQLSDAETLLQNLFDERFQLLDEKENLTEDKNILLKCLQK